LAASEDRTAASALRSPLGNGDDRADERECIADERDGRADLRGQIADRRDQAAADKRDRAADERDRMRTSDSLSWKR
jgi:hypothetical protein